MAPMLSVSVLVPSSAVIAAPRVSHVRPEAYGSPAHPDRESPGRVRCFGARPIKKRGTKTMPAVNPSDWTALPCIPPPPPDAAERPVLGVADAPTMLEGEGFKVRRAFAGIDLRFADPFLLLDHMGAVEYAPGEAKGAPDHPHRGFETVTYMMDGELVHRDSNGGGGLITDGATQWMTAGAGIVHSEMPTERIVARGGRFHGVQLWVNLPKTLKWTPSRYQDIEANSVSLMTSDDAGSVVRLIAGDLAGHAGPGATHTPITYAHATI